MRSIPVPSSLRERCELRCHTFLRTLFGSPQIDAVPQTTCLKSEPKLASRYSGFVSSESKSVATCFRVGSYVSDCSTLRYSGPLKGDSLVDFD